MPRAQVWYCVSPKDRKRFEAVARAQFSNESHACAAFMRHKDVMMSPKLLRKSGIPYTTVCPAHRHNLTKHCEALQLSLMMPAASYGL